MIIECNSTYFAMQQIATNSGDTEIWLYKSSELLMVLEMKMKHSINLIVTIDNNPPVFFTEVSNGMYLVQSHYLYSS